MFQIHANFPKYKVSDDGKVYSIRRLSEISSVLTRTGYVDYVITAKGWRASGGIKCKNPEDKHFWSMLQMVVNDIIKGKRKDFLNESYTSGFARYVRPVEMNKNTWRWEEINYDTSETIIIGEEQE